MILSCYAACFEVLEIDVSNWWKPIFSNRIDYGSIENENEPIILLVEIGIWTGIFIQFLIKIRNHLHCVLNVQRFHHINICEEFRWDSYSSFIWNKIKYWIIESSRSYTKQKIYILKRLDLFKEYLTFTIITEIDENSGYKFSCFVSHLILIT